MSHRRIVSMAVVFCTLMAAGAAAQPVFFNIPYNVDVVREPGGSVTDGLGFRKEALVTQSEAAANDALTPRGLPDDGRISISGTTFQLGPFNGNNALRIGPGEEVTIAVTPFQYNDVHIFAVSGDGVRIDNLTSPPTLVRTSNTQKLFVHLRYQNHPSGMTEIGPPNYLEETGAYLIDGMDSTGANGAGFLNIDDAAIFESHLEMVGSTAIPPLVGLTLVNLDTTAANHASVYIFGAYAVAPEPASLAIIMMSLVLAVRRRSP